MDWLPLACVRIQFLQLVAAVEVVEWVRCFVMDDRGMSSES